jgi:hypothetical protein
MQTIVASHRLRVAAAVGDATGVTIYAVPRERELRQKLARELARRLGRAV